MRLPFMGPSREEVVGIATYLTARFGGEALEEARRLEEVVKTLRYPRNIELHRRVTLEIEKGSDPLRQRRLPVPPDEHAE